MISDEEVKSLFQNTWRAYSKHYDYKKPHNAQFFRGIDSLKWENQHPDGCKRHLWVFDQFNVIPKYCFNCYKVQIEPRTVVELFKLMMVIEKLDLPNDNTRKCTVENRQAVSGTYKGLIYCQSLDEGKEVLEIARQVVAEEISKDVPVSLKRGCSEYAVTYPEYAQTGQDKPAMEYRDEWQGDEEQAGKEWAVINTSPPASPVYEPQTYTPRDALVMFTWLKYAATIGDDSYLKICWRLQPFHNVERPSPFRPAEND